MSRFFDDQGQALKSQYVQGTRKGESLMNVAFPEPRLGWIAKQRNCQSHDEIVALTGYRKASRFQKEVSGLDPWRYKICLSSRLNMHVEIPLSSVRSVPCSPVDVSTIFPAATFTPDPLRSRDLLRAGGSSGDRREPFCNLGQTGNRDGARPAYVDHLRVMMPVRTKSPWTVKLC